MNGILAIDNKLDEIWYPLSTHRNIHEMTRPYKITGYLLIPSPVISMIATWLNSDD